MDTPNYNKLNFNYEIKVKSDKGNDFLINFSAETYSFLEIKAIKKNDLTTKTFFNQFSPEKIKENRYMLAFDDLDEICQELSGKIKENGIQLTEEIDNVCISIPLNNSKIKEIQLIQFTLNEIKKDEKESMNELFQLIDKLNNENQLLKKEIKEIKAEYKKEITEITLEYEKKIDNLKSIANNSNNEINKLKEQMKTWLDYKDYIDSKNKIEINSLIINNNINYQKTIKKWIDKDNDIQAKLLYRKSRDGNKISTFHQLCDNKGPTLTLFITDDGNIGGLYTPLSWDCVSKWKNDNDTLIFNLSKKKKYKKNQKNCSIYCDGSYGPKTYGFGFYKPNQMDKIEHLGTSINNYFENGADILLNNSTIIKYFNTNEVEVFEIKKVD